MVEGRELRIDFAEEQENAPGTDRLDCLSDFQHFNWLFDPTSASSLFDSRPYSDVITPHLFSSINHSLICQSKYIYAKRKQPFVVEPKQGTTYCVIAQERGIPPALFVHLSSVVFPVNTGPTSLFLHFFYSPVFDTTFITFSPLRSPL